MDRETLLPPSQGGRIAAQPPGDFFTNGVQVQLTAMPDSGWAFGNWQSDFQGSTNPLTLLMDRDWRVGATFNPPPTFKLVVQAVGGGSVTGDPPGSYSPGSILQLAAQPATGWRFLGWGGDANGTSTNLSLLMNRDQTVIAYFQPIALTAVTAGGGSIQGNSQPLYPYGTVVVLTALPDPGWQFLSWMGDSQGTNATISVTMDGPREVQAEFGTSINVTNAGSGMVIRTSAREPVPWGGAGSIVEPPAVTRQAGGANPSAGASLAW